MIKTLILSLTAATGIILTGLTQAATPNTTRTLTSGIGSGATTSRVPSSHPYTSRSRGYASSGHSRSSYADRSLTNFASGTIHRPDSAYHPGGSNPTYGRPSSIPATLPDQAAGRIPGTIGSTGMTGANGLAGAVSNPPPVSIPASIPDPATGRVPAVIGGMGISSPPPTGIPANIPGQAAGHVPGSIGGRP